MQSDEWINRVAARRLSRRRFLNAAAFAGLGAAGLALVGCGGDDDDDGGGAAAAAAAPAEAPAEATAERGTVINVTLSDFKIEVSAGTAEPGAVTFVVTNNGPSVHEFVVLGDNLPNATGLPLTAARDQVDEVGRGIALSVEIEEFPAGETRELTIPDMAGGRYVLICNIPGHYQEGMRIGFLVGEGVTLGT